MGDIVDGDMATVELPVEIIVGLKKEARRKHKSVATLAAEALANYLEYLEDVRDVKAAKKAGGRSYTLEEVERHLGL